VTERIRLVCRLDFIQQPRMDATYAEHAKILQAIQHKSCDQAGVRKITQHPLHMARQAVC